MPLGVVRVLPSSGVGLWGRLLAATFLLIGPGLLIAASTGLPLFASGFVCSLAFVGLGLGTTVLLHASIGVALVVTSATAVVALIFTCGRGVRSDAGRQSRASVMSIVLVGLLLGVLVWRVTPPLSGDALFHLARVRKLLALPHLSLTAVDEFSDGGLHPGYAFPLWHGWLALVARIAGLDPGVVIRREAAVLVPVAVGVAYECGRAIFASAAGGVAVAIVQVTLVAIAPGHGGAYVSLSLPATLSRHVLELALFALIFGSAGRARRIGFLKLGVIAAAAAELALVHVTYALFALLVLTGYWVVRLFSDRKEARRLHPALAVSLTAIGLVVAWLAPLASSTRSHNPRCTEIARAFANYAGQIIHRSCTDYRLAPDMLGRSGAIAIAGLLLVPVAAFAGRRHWSAIVLGGSTLILMLLLLPWTFPHFADVVSISQARRAAGFVPISFAVVGGLSVLVAARQRLTLAGVAVAGAALDLAYPGSFAPGAPHGIPGFPAWVALIGGSLAIALVSWRVNLPDLTPATIPLIAATVLLVAAAMFNGLDHWTTARTSQSRPVPASLVALLNQPKYRGVTIYAEPQISYELAAAAPVYIADAPTSHVANTPANDPYRRRSDALRFFQTGALEIPHHYRACAILLPRPTRITLRLPVIYRSSNYSLYALSADCRASS